MEVQEGLERNIDRNCEFCRIIRRETEAHIVWEDDVALAFFPLAPAVAGHTLVVPKQHIVDYWAADEDIVKYLAGRIDAVPADACKKPGIIVPTIQAVMAITDDDLLDMASAMPVIEGEPWHSGVANRLRIVKWLVQRGSTMKEVLSKWARG